MASSSCFRSHGACSLSAPDPRPAKRHKADIDEWKILRKLKLGPCRVCECVFGVEIGLHHLIPRSLGGSDVPDNLVPLCGSGTTGCHGAVEARTLVACQLLRASLTLRE